MSYYPTDCAGCGKPIEGAWDSQIELGVETGEIADKASNRLFIYDKHIRCSPSRAQRIVHPDFPPVVDDREGFDQRLWPEDRRELEQVRVEIKNFSEDFPESRGEMLTDVLCHRIEEKFERF